MATPSIDDGATPITSAHREIAKRVAARAQSQEPRPGVKRARCALDGICGAAIALEVSGDVAGAQSLTNLAYVVSIHGWEFLKEFSEGGK